MQLVFSIRLLPLFLFVFRHVYFRKDMYMWPGRPCKIHIVGPGQSCLLVWCLCFSCYEIVHYSLFPVLMNCVTFVKTNSEALPGDGERCDAFFFSSTMYMLIVQRRLVHKNQKHYSQQEHRLKVRSGVAAEKEKCQLKCFLWQSLKQRNMAYEKFSWNSNLGFLPNVA